MRGRRVRAFSSSSVMTENAAASMRRSPCRPQSSFSTAAR